MSATTTTSDTSTNATGSTTDDATASAANKMAVVSRKH